ncbi:ATP-dependent helicase [Kribbella albertanoniae]|uniref:DNA 3'-5' helicase n=1 Tax=Kribbella albertanoniae TaxID=1266829 RepID=A0A4R4PT94_9ACTN|nr:ATP-dependent DNA helicase [Kribbella albertanoniae]TDC25600.1 ATP-dependent helicase [Kribbella albertanoniae]
MVSRQGSRYRLVRAEGRAAQAPVLDADQQAVVDHPGGPLLVLAGPGTGKTTTLVEAVVDRVRNRGLSPDEVLVLTFGRKAATELRDRITGRLGKTTRVMPSMTFHSFCYALLRRFTPADAFDVPLRLPSGPEQSLRLSEALSGSREVGAVHWPRSLHPALKTRGFTDEVQAVIGKARQLGLDPEDLTEIGRSAERAEWVAVGDFFEEYLQILDHEQVLDYSELIHRAVILAQQPSVQDKLRAEFKAVFVDEYQDTDPGQTMLLQAIAGDGRDLVVVGDPDQSIYTFRGADVRGLLRFTEEFPSVSGEPAAQIALATTRRFGTTLQRVSRNVVNRLGVPGALDRDTFDRFRNPDASSCVYGAGKVEANLYSTSGAELEHIADLLRRAHVQDGVGWHEMAVLVRSGSRSIPPLRRALAAAGIPVDVAGDELPLSREPAVRPMLLALRAVADPATLTVDVVRALALSPLGAMDAGQLRRLARVLRKRDREAADGQRLPKSSDELLRDALLNPLLLDEQASPAEARFAALGERLLKARNIVNAGAAPDEVMWSLWSESPWLRRLRGQAHSGGETARAANRDLDSLCALFDAAGRAEEQIGFKGVSAFLSELESLDIAGDNRFDGTYREAGVQLMTAHRSKGLQWRLVVVAGVQEAQWPDLRRRGSLLQPDRLGRDGLVDPLSAGALLAEERRLFYVAITRARERLIVTAVQAPEADGDQPSRFLGELDIPLKLVAGRPRRPLSLPGLVADLRCVLADPASSPALKRVAADRLAQLADAVDDREQALVPTADPGRWWGVRERTKSERPIADPELPVPLSGSALTTIVDCPLRWFLTRRAGGETPSTSAIGFGQVLHTLADAVATGTLPPSVDELNGWLDKVWTQLDFESAWISDRERVEAEQALRRFVAWHQGRPERTLVGTEVEFDVLLPDAEQPAVRVKGRMDRVEKDGEGTIRVVDLKTGRNLPTKPALARHVQLAIYQRAIASRQVAAAGPEAVAGGAELVQLRHDDSGFPKVQHQAPLDPDDNGKTWLDEAVEDAEHMVRTEEFTAQRNDGCSRCEAKPLCPIQPEGREIV